MICQNGPRAFPKQSPNVPKTAPGQCQNGTRAFPKCSPGVPKITTGRSQNGHRAFPKSARKWERAAEKKGSTER
eukprot:10455451-Alexandrium_andersonii.AAC.1